MTMTHYDTLKVTQDAPTEVITAAYKALAMIYHPDHNVSNPDAIVKMQNINVAYKILSDPEKRAEHDKWIHSRERRSRPPSADTTRQRVADPAGGADLKAKAEKANAEASKWAIWASKTAQDSKEAQARLEKAQADLAKAKESERPKWETWVAKMAQEAKEAKERADKAIEQASKVTADAAEATTQAQPPRTEDK